MDLRAKWRQQGVGWGGTQASLELSLVNICWSPLLCFSCWPWEEPLLIRWYHWERLSPAEVVKQTDLPPSLNCTQKHSPQFPFLLGGWGECFLLS